METNKARQYLKEAMDNDRTFDKYIDTILAGDSACKIAGVLKSKIEPWPYAECRVCGADIEDTGSEQFGCWSCGKKST